jgi:predicted transposase YdaD
LRHPKRGALSKRFDATAKELLERHPRAWLEFLLRLKLSAVRVVDADLSTITSEADKVLRAGGRKPWIVHVELVSSGESKLALRIQRYILRAGTSETFGDGEPFSEA